MKKRLIIEIVCGALIFIIGFFIGDSTAIKRVNATITKNVQTNEKSKNNNTIKEKTIKAENDQVEVGSTKMGEIAKVGDAEFKVLDVKNSKEVKIGENEVKKTNDNFVIIKLEIVNKDNSPRELSNIAKVALLGRDKMLFNSNSDIEINLTTYKKVYKKEDKVIYRYDGMNPGIKYQTYCVFETSSPIDNGYVLALEDERDNNKGVLLELTK